MSGGPVVPTNAHGRQRGGARRRRGTIGGPIPYVRRPRVLVVDDDVDTRELLSFTLTEAGCHVVAVGGGMAALMTARQQRPNILVLDLSLGYPIDGDRALREIRGLAGLEQVPSIAVSGLSDGAVRARRAGFDFYLPKPCDPQMLIGAIDRILGRPDRAGRSQPRG